MLRLLLPISVVFALTACGLSTQSAPKTEPIKLPALPSNMATCGPLRSVSSRIKDDQDEITVAQLKVLWGQDRAVAAQCQRRLTGMVSFYEELRQRMLLPDLK